VGVGRGGMRCRVLIDRCIDELAPPASGRWDHCVPSFTYATAPGMAGQGVVLVIIIRPPGQALAMARFDSDYLRRFGVEDEIVACLPARPARQIPPPAPAP
jgi:hypothetical protein